MINIFTQVVRPKTLISSAKITAGGDTMGWPNGSLMTPVLLVHEADQSLGRYRSLYSHMLSVRMSVPTFHNRPKQSKSSLLAMWIIDDFCFIKYFIQCQASSIESAEKVDFLMGKNKGRFHVVFLFLSQSIFVISLKLDKSASHSVKA